MRHSLNRCHYPYFPSIQIFLKCQLLTWWVNLAAIVQDSPKYPKIEQHNQQVHNFNTYCHSGIKASNWYAIGPSRLLIELPFDWSHRIKIENAIGPSRFLQRFFHRMWVGAMVKNRKSNTSITLLISNISQISGTWSKRYLPSEDDEDDLLRWSRWGVVGAKMRVASFFALARSSQPNGGNGK